MTIQTSVRKARFIGNGVNTSFPFTFKTFSATDLVLTQTSTAGVDSPITSLFSIALNTDQEASPGGTITYPTSGSPMANNVVLTLTSNLAQTQLTDLTNAGGFFAKTISDRFDYLTILIQQLASTLAGALTVSVSDPAPNLSLGTAVQRALKYIQFDGSGNAALAQSLPSGTLSASSIGSFLYPQTGPETLALVTPPNLQYAPDDLRRFGVVGDGVTVDDTGFANVMLVAAKGQAFTGLKNAVYTLSTGMVVGLGGFVFDGRGSTIRASATAGRLVSSGNVLAAATATTSVSSGSTQGSRSVVVVSATNLVVGQWVRVQDANQNYPAFWSTITSIGGTTIGLDRPFPLNYAGSTINFLAYTTAQIGGLVDIKNVTFDGTNISTSPGNDGSAMRLIGFETVRLTNVSVQNFNPPTTGADIVHGEDNINWFVDGCTSKNCSPPNATGTFYASRSRKAIYTRNNLESDAFGMNADWCEDAVFVGNIGNGRTALETGTGITPGRSVRGIKFNACAFAVVTGNSMSDYESPIRGSIVHRFNVTGNSLHNCGLQTYAGQIALNISNGSFVEEIIGVCNSNTIENCGGIGIGIDDGNGGVTDSQVECIGNIVNGTQGIGIYLPIGKASVHGNKIINWNQRAAAGDLGAGIYHNGGLSATNNEFKNTTTTYPCFRQNFVSGQIYWLSGNFSPSSNPTFSGGAVDWATSGTANLGAAATSVTFNHNCVVSPRVGDVTLSLGNLPTSAIGELCLTAITATQLTVTTRTAPGASTLNIAWSIKITTPHTAP